MNASEIVRLVDFVKMGGLVPVIVQDAKNCAILMLAYMNAEALEETLRTRQLCYYSRSRKKLWRKGEESGHTQELVELRLDCDGDALLALVRQKGAACHEGYRTCFFRTFTEDGIRVIGERLFDPNKIYKKQPKQ